MICAGVSDEDLGEVRPMKNLWKRTLSLVLSGVLLLGSLPMDVFAEEETTAPVETTVVETQPIETEIQPEETKPTVTETQPATEPAAQVITDDVAADGLENETEPAIKVLVDNKDVTEEGQFDRNIVSYDATQKELTLRDATVTSVESNDDLTVILPKDTETEISGSISAKNLTIKGDGTLTVGQIVTSENLIVSSDIVAGKDKENPEDDTLDVITVKNTATFAESAHLIVEAEGHNVIAFTDEENPQNNYLAGEGYYRVSEGDFLPVTDKVTVTADGYFEFISADHLMYENNDTHHMRVCETECALDKATVLTEKHSEGQEGDLEAGCGEKAKCHICGVYGTEVSAHRTTQTEYRNVDNQYHKEVYVCCKAEKKTEEHALQYFVEDSTIYVKCTICEETGSVALAASDKEITDVMSNGATISAEGLLSDENPTIIYYARANDETQTPLGGSPNGIGSYLAEIEVGGVTASAAFKITKINLSNATVTVGGTYTYDGTAHEPENITVTRNGKTLVNGTDYTVSFSNNINAGTASVAVKAAENSDYMGEAAGTFTIQKNQLTDADVKIGTKLTYNGEEQTQTVVKTVEDSDVTFEVKDNKQTNAGDNYQLIVEGTGNYAGEVKLTYSIAKASAYTDATKKNQIVGTGMTGLQMPKFEGINETVDGKYTYQWNGTEIDSSVISSEVAKLKDGDTANLSYVFVPNSNSNYVAEERKGSITIKRVELVFEVEGEAGTMVPATEDNAVTILNEEKCIYGQDGIVTPKSIRVSYGGYSDSSPTYTVKYQRGTEAEQDSPSAGINDFIIYYSGTINNVDYQNVRVTTGKVSVAPKKPTPVAPNAKKLIFNDEDQELVEQGSPEMGVLKYSLYEEHSYETTVPKRRTAGAYYVWYKEVTPDNDNYADSDPQNVLVVIAPKLEAVYRQQLRDISSQLTGGFSWYTPEYPETNFVGEVGIQNVKLNYTPSDTVNYPTITNGYEVPITVAPKQINAIVTLEKTHYKYGLTSSGAPSKREPIPVVKYTEIEVVSTNVNETEKKTLDSKEYTVTYENNENPGTATVKVTSNNYQFVNGTAAESGSTIEEEFTIYRPGVYKLSVVPTKLAETYTSLNKLEEALVKGLEDDHDKDDMVFYNVKMQEYVSAEKKWESTTDEKYFPKNDGYFTFAINYPTGTNKNTKFEAVAINTMNEGSREVIPIKLEPKDEKLEFKMESYAAVCLAWNGYNDNSTFKVTTSAKNGTVKFNVGSDSTTKTESDAVKVKEKITVTATPKSGYALTEVKYTYNSGAFSVKVEQDSSGKYIFEMPAKDINITASFKKKTTNTKNPYSGDNSNIQLWVTVLAASGAAIGVLMAFWFKKRKK